MKVCRLIRILHQQMVKDPKIADYDIGNAFLGKVFVELTIDHDKQFIGAQTRRSNDFVFDEQS